MKNTIICIQVTLDSEIPASRIRAIKQKLHHEANELTDGITNRSVMSVIRVEEQQHEVAAQKGGRR
jgi:hypothetical protein